MPLLITRSAAAVFAGIRYRIDLGQAGPLKSRLWWTIERTFAHPGGRTKTVEIGCDPTSIETLGHFKRLGLSRAVCIVIRLVFAEDAYAQLLADGTARVVSTDSIPHPSNTISITSLLAKASAELFGDAPPKERS